MRVVMMSKFGSHLLIAALIAFALLQVYFFHKMNRLAEKQAELRASISDKIGLRRHVESSGLIKEELDDQVIIYNRIPKTGSTSLMGVAYELCTRNGFHVVHLNTSKNSHILSPADQLGLSKNLSGWEERRPALFHGHLAYFDLSSYGVPLRPLYINVVREPLDRLVSYYYFLRYGDDFRPQVSRRKKGNKETFDECVKRSGNDCDPSNLWMQVPFFCGHHALCWEPGNTWALQQAKGNLARSYFLVGTTENLDEFVTLLEVSLPRFFKGASALFKIDGKSHLRKTFGKISPSSESLKSFHKSKVWQLEQDFYMFVKKEFAAVRKRALPPNGSILPLPPQFRFEKIRPK